MGNCYGCVKADKKQTKSKNKPKTTTPPATKTKPASPKTSKGDDGAPTQTAAASQGAAAVQSPAGGSASSYSGDDSLTYAAALAGPTLSMGSVSAISMGWGW